MPPGDGELQLPFHQAEESLRSARVRAGLHAEEPVEGSSTAPSPAPQPAAVVSVALEDVVISVPYGEEPGVAIRSTELWAAAFAQVGWQPTPFPPKAHKRCIPVHR